jgi:Asp-tRNA(Asn)/Glu-tRNA(Gln) amidotransferase A subunit family amidase
MTGDGWNTRSATAAAAAMDAGGITSEGLVKACLARIEERDGVIGAWIHMDAGLALAQARAADERRAAGEPLGPLNGLPVGIKDIFDTADMPTENGARACAGRRPKADSAVVSLLRQAGAVILGKTATTEFALSHPAKTVNPLDPRRTPGGSSSGTAAAVADDMVPLAIGTQTAGSTIRPASYCGTYSFKPSHGSISRHGMNIVSRRLDTVGLFAREVGDIALMAAPLMVPDARDPDVPADAPAGLGGDGTPLAAAPRLAFVRTQVWEQGDADARAALETFAAAWPAFIEETELPAAFDTAIETHAAIMNFDIAASLAEEYDQRRDLLSDTLRVRIEKGQKVTLEDYRRAMEYGVVLERELTEFFGRFDAIVTLSAPGEALMGLESTGNAAFCAIWTLLGTPAVSLPLLSGKSGMPLGVQLVGPKHADARLLATAEWLVNAVNI